MSPFRLPTQSGKASVVNPLAIQSVRIHFDPGLAARPKAFYERLNLRDWLDTLDWLFAESSDRLYELETETGESTSQEIERERDILRMLEDEIREADRAYCRLALGQQ